MTHLQSDYPSADELQDLLRQAREERAAYLTAALHALGGKIRAFFSGTPAALPPRHVSC